MSTRRPLSVAEQPMGFGTLWIFPPKASIMNRVISKAFPAVHALIQSSGNRKADPSQYTTNLDFYGITVIERFPSQVLQAFGEEGKGFECFQIL